MKALIVTDISNCVLQLVPDSALILRNNPWFRPADASANAVAQVFAGAVISRLGKNIAAKFATRYYSQLVTAVHPAIAEENASIAWCRDGALIVAPDTFDPAAVPENFREVLNRAIEKVSAYITLKTGDLILLPVDHPSVPLDEGLTTEISSFPGTPPVLLKVR